MSHSRHSLKPTLSDDFKHNISELQDQYRIIGVLDKCGYGKVHKAIKLVSADSADGGIQNVAIKQFDTV